MDADVIISVCAPTFACYITAEVAMRTCAASSDANVVLVANNMPVLKFRDTLFANAQTFGMKWQWYESPPLNIIGCINQSIRLTSGKYYVVCHQDVVFYAKWLENLIEAWEAEPDYFCLSPYSFNHWRNDETFALSTSPRPGILETWPHALGTFAFRRDKAFYFDENILCEGDSDLYHHCKKNKLRTGIVLNSRVDHLGQVVLTETKDWGAIMGNPHQRQEDAQKLKEKWNL